jgi:hypothetical protein
MRTTPTSWSAGTLAGIALVLTACGDPPSVPSHATMHANVTASSAANPAAAGLYKSVHSAAARFHSTTQATKAGYVEASPCIAAPGLGTMGFHWVNDALVDPVFDPLNPEAVLYLPDKNGNYKLVAVEYIVIDVGQPRPAFDGYDFDIGGTPVPVAHWSLHTWLYAENPAGVHAPFNPAISCPT